MANEDDLPLPIEIPWRLASTTQLLNAGDPDQTTISLFTFQPDDEDLLSDFPGQKIVLLKVTVSISPASFPPGTVPPIASALGEGIPCYHVLLDLKVRKEDGQLGTDRPYFHAAAPLRRQMLQTGVIGTDLFEGAADSQFVGRSGSQVHEITSSHTRTSSRAGGVSLLGIGVSARTTTTDVTGTRDVTQVTDTTTREASRERRELVSHMTKVENILTLLNAKYVGTPYLSFSLAPQPLQQLSADSTDPSLWFSQLLQRRSSGIEGVQEFTAVILVPDGEDFCVEARLRRVCVLDDPPGPPNFQEPFSLAAPKLGRLLNYLFDTYPIGTPLEELDVDLLQGLPQPELFPRPAVEMWVIAPAGAMLADILSPRPQVLGQMSRATVSYKTFIELWLETLRAEYERDLMRSPLERGVLVGEDRTLDTCFSFAEGNLLKVLKTSTNVSPLSVLPFRVGELDVGVPQATTTTAARRGVKAQALETVTRWNALEQRLATVLANNRSRFRAEPGKFNDPRVVGVLIDRWAKLAADDPLNLDFNAAANALKLSDVHRRALKSAGATDLQSMARALKAAQVIERYNQDLAQRPREARADRTALATPIEFPLPAKLAAEIVKAIGDTVFGGEAKPPITRRRR